jgi:DnaJ-class molecular chaperone
MSNPYKTLGVDANATQDEIKSVYRKLAKEFHPDLNPGNKKSEGRFKDIASAYDVIGNAENRAKFDRGELEAEIEKKNSRRPRGPYYSNTQRDGGRYANQFEGMDEDTFNAIFGQMGRQQPVQQVYQLEIELKDSVLGAEREITFPDGNKVLVRIPPGVESGAKLRFKGKGEVGGDIYVQLNVKLSPIFKRVGKNLEMDLPVSFSDAILAKEVTVPTIDGSVLMKIPRNVTSDQRMRVKGKGVGDAVSGTRGDQIATLRIKMPENVDDELRKAVEDWTLRKMEKKHEK